MNKLVGNPRKLFKIIHKRYTSNNKPINSDELVKIFTNTDQLEEDLQYLHNLNLIETDYDYNYHLTTQGRIYFKLETANSVEDCIKSIAFPLIVAFITALITTLSTLWLNN